MTRAVEDVLEEIGAGDRPRLLVLNKADALDDERRRELAFRHPDAVLVSRADRRGPRGAAASGSRPSSSARCRTSSCSCRSPRAARCPSCTTSPATSSARTPPRACASRARLPAVVAERFDRYAVDGAATAPGGVAGQRRPRSRSRPRRARLRELVDDLELRRPVRDEQELGDAVAGLRREAALAER